LNNLQHAGGQEFFNYLMQQLSQPEIQQLEFSLQAVQEMAQQ